MKEMERIPQFAVWMDNWFINNANEQIDLKKHLHENGINWYFFHSFCSGINSLSSVVTCSWLQIT